MLLNILLLYKKINSMLDHNQTLQNNQKRRKSLLQLNKFYEKIEYIELSEDDFPTKDLEQLSFLIQYSIHPTYSDKKTADFNQKLSQHYWSNLGKIRNSLEAQRSENQQNQNQNDVNLEVKSSKSTQNDKLSNSVSETNDIQPHLEIIEEKKVTEAIFEHVHLEIKVAKKFHQIKQFLQQTQVKQLANKSIISKVQLLSSWTSFPNKLMDFTPKKPNLSTKNTSSYSDFDSIKLSSKYARKDSNISESSRSIILGKNQSTQTKQMKHMLKVQAKTNFVEQKRKEQLQLSSLQKKSIQLNYLLNVITRQFFQDFSNDILIVIKQNIEIIPIFCQKIVEKIKEQHNFISIYVDLLKKLCKSQIEQDGNQKKENIRFNKMQINFVEYLQKSFSQLISQNIQSSESNFYQYKFQKQIIGMCTFIGQLIKENILSKKIFKVCFWELIRQYVLNVKEHPQNDMTNECLISGIVLIADSMDVLIMSKLMQKEAFKSNQQQRTSQHNLQKMVEALVNPNDTDRINRQTQCKSLISEIKIEEYPDILMGIVQVFGSKRMKLRFLIQSWQIKLKKTKQKQTEQILQKQEQEQSEQQIKVPISENLIQIKKCVHEFVKQIKCNQMNLFDIKTGKTKKSHELCHHQELIKEYLKSQQVQRNKSISLNQESNHKIFKLLVTQFLNQFSDSKKLVVIFARIQYFFEFINYLEVSDANKKLLETITEEQFQNLMIIQCDYPFLVDSVCHIFMRLMKSQLIEKEQILNRIIGRLDTKDEDMMEFYQKVKSHLTKLVSEQAKED